MKKRPEFLTAEEERELATKARAGDIAARDRLVESQTGLVHKAARRFAGMSAPAEDLAQEGMIGVMRAVEKFDPSKGYRLSTYAKNWIVSGITRSIRKKAALIKIPNYVQVQKDGMWKGKPIPPPPSVFSFSACVPNQDGQKEDGFGTAFDKHDHIAEVDGRDELRINLGRMEEAMCSLTHEQRTWLRMEYGLNDSRPMNHKQQRLLLHKGDDALMEIRETTMSKLREAMLA